MFPSQKTLERAFPGKGKELRELLTRKRKTRDYSDVTRWEAECYNKPKYRARLFVALNQVAECHGSEAVFGDGETWPDCEYLNTGDTYTMTLLYDYTRNRWLVTSLGDWIESQERRGVHYT